MSNITEEAVEQINSVILKKKEEIIKKLLKKNNLSYILKNITKKRFKRLEIEQHEDGSETVWIDNNTIDGFRLVTFFKCEPDLNGTDLKIDLKYI